MTVTKLPHPYYLYCCNGDCRSKLEIKNPNATRAPQKQGLRDAGWMIVRLRWYCPKPECIIEAMRYRADMDDLPDFPWGES